MGTSFNYGTCQSCGQSIVIGSDGLINHHVLSEPNFPTCPGALKVPLEGVLPEVEMDEPSEIKTWGISFHPRGVLPGDKRIKATEWYVVDGVLTFTGGKQDEMFTLANVVTWCEVED